MCQTSATASLSPAAARSSLWTVSLNLLAFHATVASAGNVSALHSSRSTGDVEIIDIDADKRGSQRRSLRRAAKRVSSGEGSSSRGAVDVGDAASPLHTQRALREITDGEATSRKLQTSQQDISCADRKWHLSLTDGKSW